MDMASQPEQVPKKPQPEPAHHSNREISVKYDLDGKIFHAVSNTENGEVSSDTLFHYRQEGDVIWADYYGGAVVKGHLLGRMLETGELDFRYHHINEEGRIMLGKCRSTPEFLADGRLKFREHWQWLVDDNEAGDSEIEEIDSV